MLRARCARRPGPIHGGPGLRDGRRVGRLAPWRSSARLTRSFQRALGAQTRLRACSGWRRAGRHRLRRQGFLEQAEFYRCGLACGSRRCRRTPGPSGCPAGDEDIIKSHGTSHRPGPDASGSSRLRGGIKPKVAVALAVASTNNNWAWSKRDLISMSVQRRATASWRRARGSPRWPIKVRFREALLHGRGRTRDAQRQPHDTVNKRRASPRARARAPATPSRRRAAPVRRLRAHQYGPRSPSRFHYGTISNLRAKGVTSARSTKRRSRRGGAGARVRGVVLPARAGAQAQARGRRTADRPGGAGRHPLRQADENLSAPVEDDDDVVT